MSSKWAMLAAVLGLLFAPVQEQYQEALPGYRYEFPRDHFAHPAYQTEWWYYTGNLTATDGRHFGFELTFFREGVSRDGEKTGSWDVRDLYLAHLALSDLDGGRFYHAERLNRAGPGIAGVDATAGRIFNGNWEAKIAGDTQALEAVDRDFSLHLKLASRKKPVIHGENGVSQKAQGAGRASHYYSLTRLETSGTIELAGKRLSVSGLAWMDHEFFTHQMEKEQVGWDWFSIQLNDGSELMVFELRRKDGSGDPYSSGTFVDKDERTTHLGAAEFSLTPAGAQWTSPATHATYPVSWRISVPKLGLSLKATTKLKSQEMTGQTRLAPSYWEGAIQVEGTSKAADVQGVGYLEMTGYDRPVDLMK